MPSMLCRTLSTTVNSPTNHATGKQKPNQAVLIHSAKKNVPQSPWKMNFLVKLVRGRWLPDALAQMKFSPKHRSEDVAKILQRGADIAKLYHSAIPEELIVKEVIVTKGMMHKRRRIMARGRSGFGYRRATHVSTTLELIDFEARMAAAQTHEQRREWKKRQELVISIKKSKPKTEVITPAAGTA